MIRQQSIGITGKSVDLSGVCSEAIGNHNPEKIIALR